MPRVLLLHLALLLPTLAYGQTLQLAATTPAVGDSSVALATTVSFTFDGPLDTTARFRADLPLAFAAISPSDSIQIDGFAFSDGDSTVTFDVTHAADTDFVWILTGARGRDGEAFRCENAFASRGNVAILSYTTAPRRGEAVVSGGVQLWIPLAKQPDPCPYGPGVVALLRTPPAFAPLGRSFMPPDTLRLDVAAATTWAGEDEVGRATYTLPHVRAGVYWPVTFFGEDDGDGWIECWAECWLPYRSGPASPVPDSLVVASASVRANFEAYGLGSTETTEIPGVAALLPTYPNPFNPQTTIPFRLDRPAAVRLTLYDLHGRRVATLADRAFPAGHHELTWTATGFPSGLYLVRLTGPDFSLSRRLILLK